MDIQFINLYQERPMSLSCNGKRKRLVYFQSQSTRGLSSNVLETADEQHSSSFQTIILKATQLMLKKQWEALIVLCDNGLQIQEDAELYNMKGRAEGKLGNLKSKIELVEKAIELNPKSAAYYRNLGSTQYKLKKYELALQNHTKALELEPSNSINYHNIGTVIFRLRRFEEAIIYFKKSIELNKYQAHSYRWLGNCLKEQGKIRKALNCYYRAYDLSQKQIDKHEIVKLQKCINPWRLFLNHLFIC